MAVSSLLLFGPTSPRLNQSFLSELRKSLNQYPELNFLVEVIQELPSLWPTLQTLSPRLSTIQGNEQLDQLKGLSSMTLPDSWVVGNIVSAPLTVISQTVDFFRLSRKAGNARFPNFDNVQGFCIGFLTAAALAISKDEDDFRHFVSIAIRLAVCIGSIIDLNESSLNPLDRSFSMAVRWQTVSGKQELEQVLRAYPSAYISCFTDEDSVTVTIPCRLQIPFSQSLSECGLHVQEIELHGQYHHPTHIKAVQEMKTLLNLDKHFQLLVADRLILPLRSNADAKLVTQGALHEIALDSIMTMPSHWYQTVKATVVAMGEQNVNVKCIGAESILPRSVASGITHEARPPGHSNQVISLCSGLSTDSSVSDQSSVCPTPCTGGDLSVEGPTVSTSAIAVVGMACRFPKADSLDQYWQMIRSGDNAVQHLPKDRFDPAELWRDPKGPFLGNFISDPDAFDHRFFSISAREAKSMDPQQRLLLQVVYEAMESSGFYGPRQGSQSNRIGSYVGVGSVDYEDNVASENATAFSALGTLRAFISGRLSHYFGWSGPSITFDTACSSSAVAIHSACKALQGGECDMAVAGGVNIITSPKLFQNLAAGGFLNSSGASKAFDAGANGYCRGEGAGVVVLKPLARAIADGSSVLGVIAGSAINQGSNCTPIMVPVTESQSSLYQQALARANVDPLNVSYVEAHGTGTPVGDPIECESIRRTFTGARRTQELFLGSVKDNIGHAEAASGAAALIKTILMMQNGTIPKQANFRTLNPAISPLKPDRMTIPKITQPWESDTRTAVVTNYGAAGSNAAIVLQEYLSVDGGATTPNVISSHDELLEVPFYVSAKSAESLRSYCSALSSYVAKSRKSAAQNILPNLAYNLATKQNRSLPYSWSFTSKSLAALSEQLDASALGSVGFDGQTGDRRPIILCFGGQNGNTVSLCKDLFDSCRLLQLHMIRCDSICKFLGLQSIFPGIFSSESVEDVVELHCRLFCLQYACAKSWLDCGLEVDTLIGHSFGQLTALCVADAISLEDGIRLISARARLIRDEWGPETGAMLAIEGGRQDVEALLDSMKEQHPGYSAEISCYNGPKSLVVAGDKASIRAIEAALDTKEFSMTLKSQKLKNTHAFHSRLVDGILTGLREVAESVQFRKPSLRVETCSLTQSWSNVGASEIIDHSRTPVYFADAVERITARSRSCIWLEAGSGSPIIAMTRRILQSDPTVEHTTHAIDIASSKAQRNLASASSELWAAGSKAQFWPFHNCQKNSYPWINLPPYQFEKTRHWMQYKAHPSLNSEARALPVDHEPELLRKLDGDSIEALFAVNTTNEIYTLCTKGHAVLNHSLCPASMYFELAIRAARLVAEPASSNGLPRIQGLKISAPLSLSRAGKVFLQLTRDRSSNENWRFSLFSRDQPDAAELCTHASGMVALLACNTVETQGGLQSLNRLVGSSRCDSIMNDPAADGLHGAIVYKNFSRVVNYATYYRGVQRIFAKNGEAVGFVCMPGDQPPELDPGSCNPIAIDNFLQVSGIHVNCLWDCKDDEVFVCTAIRELSFSERFMKVTEYPRSWTVYTNFEQSTNGHVINDIFVLDTKSGELMLILMGASFTRLPFKSLARTLSKLNGVPQQSQLSEPSDHQEACFVTDGLYKQTDNVHVSMAQEVTDASPTTLKMQETQAEEDRVQSRVLKKLQAMLSEVLEVSIEDVQPGSALDDIGVDSLMVTELISEIQTRFNVKISNQEFQDLTDIQSLCHRLQPPASMREQIQSQEDPVMEDLDDLHARNGVHAPRDPRSTIPEDQPSLRRAASGPECFANVKQTFDLAAKETDFIGFYRDVYPMQAELVLAYVVQAFAALGCPLALLGPGQRLPDIHHSSKYAKVVGQLYKILEDAHIITGSMQNPYRTDTKVPESSAELLHDAIIKKFPQHASEHRLLHTTGPKLADCLREIDDPICLLFGNSTARALMTDVYTNAPMFKAGTLVLERYIADIFDQVDNDREIQILELGAGTGGTTSFLVNLLAKYEQKFQYTFTDLSTSLVVAAKKRFAHHKFMKYTTLDIEQAPPAQHMDQYDIVISTNCVHATKNLTASTARIKSMLHQDGILCLVELTQNLFWFDLVFGLLEGWWLFNDGRNHVLANEKLWERELHDAGFQWVDWTEGDSEESHILRCIVASPSKAYRSVGRSGSSKSIDRFENQETVAFDQNGDTRLLADIYYPEKLDDTNTSRPIALMIHGGGHVMLSRKDVRPQQTKILLEAGFLPVSVDYSLCPENNLLEGPMHDVCSALQWARNTLPTLRLERADIHPNGDRVVAVGWSTGGHLAMTLAWTAPTLGLAPPDALLAFYCPTDYEDPSWTKPNMPRGAGAEIAEVPYDLWEGVRELPITTYNPPASTRALGGWLAPDDPRSRICLHMNWKGQTVPILLNGMKLADRSRNLIQTPPSTEQVEAISPLAQIRKGSYRTPSFIVHGTKDDLIPWQQTQRTYDALCECGVEAELRIVEGGTHLFDTGNGFERNEEAARAVSKGYEFLGRFARRS